MRQHDFKNHLQALNMMIYASKDKEELTKRFEAYTGQIAYKDELNEFLKYSNKVIAGFLYGKKSQAEAQNIKFSIHINEPIFESKLNDYEWIELFGILIDNAMETGVEDNEIIVIIDKEEDMNLLMVKNKHPYLEIETIRNMFNKGVSSKSKAKVSRGYGLYNIKQIVTKYHGSIEAYNEAGAENFVVLKALIP
jgi:sensor histidine kinase regulating citrate/malate metabolism